MICKDDDGLYRISLIKILPHLIRVQYFDEADMKVKHGLTLRVHNRARIYRFLANSQDKVARNQDSTTSIYSEHHVS